jgi:hypothetical protein
MNYSLQTADTWTHLKILALSLAGTALLFWMMSNFVRI